MLQTACPLDCFDACKVKFENNSCKPNDDFITNKSLCKLFGFLQNENNLRDKNIYKTLENVYRRLKEAKDKKQKILYYKGSGNMGVMQNITKKLFENLGATFANGSLCEAAGEAGIIMGRKDVVNPPIKTLMKCDVVICWGRNFTKTSKHIYNLVKDKEFITIDPYATDIAKKSKIFLQIPPKGDYALVKLLEKILDEQEVLDDECKQLNITKTQLDKTIDLLKSKKIALMFGIGAQKYKEGAQIFHTIEKFVNRLGIFDKGGVWYLSNSGFPFNSKIYTKVTKTTPYPIVNFSDYDLVFIQGANPVISAPNSNMLREQLKKTDLIFFGTTLNDTAKYANHIIAAKTFLEKKDVRLSYGHDEIQFCDICKTTNEAISEYDFTKYMFDKFNFTGLLTQDEYFNDFKTIVNKKPQINFKEHNIKDVPLLELKENEYYLLTSKSINSLNSQFNDDQYAYIHPDLGFIDNQEITISSPFGTITIKVKNNKNIYKKAILLYAGNKKVNILTPYKISDYGNNAVFQDIKLTIKN